tara:strand:+ start:41004 stop:41222 length:219 start_codon:yes stop_codon:yes gene_type:complete
MTTKRTSKVIPNFEASLKQLEAIVDKMENQELSLEQALSQFEEGIGLTKQCQKALTQAKQKVEKLIDENNNG